MIDLREYLGLYWATEVSSLLLAWFFFFCLVFVSFFQNCLSILSEVCQDLYFCVHNNFQNYFIEICDEKIVDVLVKSCMWKKKRAISTCKKQYKNLLAFILSEFLVYQTWK